MAIVNPRFEPSYWGFDYALPLYPGGKKSGMMTGALPALAGLVPAPHRVTLIDENVEEIDFARLGCFDVIGVTGMNVQKRRMKEILLRLRDSDAVVVVGGAYATVAPSYFEGLCDAVFVGEAEETWPAFLSDLAAGRPIAPVLRQERWTEMSRVPRPRYDLLPARLYASGSLQFSRGCPYRCEFCDIAVTFGRRPRVKDPGQVIAELDDMRRAGFFSVFIVDDNFIGNKAAARALLVRILAWQEEHGFPLRLSTEASLDLADHPDLLQLMYDANFRYVFVGIETPREASLAETKKHQNLGAEPLSVRIDRIRDAGIDVYAGFIDAFDGDDTGIYEHQYRFIQENGILLAMVGMLQAIPTTPLHARLAAEGRLVEHDENLNIVPKLMTREELRAGYHELVRRLYEPEAFFERHFRFLQHPAYTARRAAIARKTGEGRGLRTLGFGLWLLLSLSVALARDGSLRSIGTAYLMAYARQWSRGRPGMTGFAPFMNRCVTHWHFYRFTREAVAGRLRLYNSG